LGSGSGSNVGTVKMLAQRPHFRLLVGNGHCDLHAVHDGRHDRDDQRHQSNATEDYGIDSQWAAVPAGLRLPLDLVHQVANGDDDLVVYQDRRQLVFVVFVVIDH